MECSRGMVRLGGRIPTLPLHEMRQTASKANRTNKDEEMNDAQQRPPTRRDLSDAVNHANSVAWAMSTAIADYFDAIENDPIVPIDIMAALARAQFEYDEWRNMPVRHWSIVKWKDATDGD